VGFLLWAKMTCCVSLAPLVDSNQVWGQAMMNESAEAGWSQRLQYKVVGKRRKGPIICS
jgi:hypothetical protein